MTIFEEIRKLDEEIRTNEQSLHLAPFFGFNRIHALRRLESLKELRSTLRILMTYYDP